MRKSLRILAKEEIIFNNIIRELHELTNVFVINPFMKSKERCHKIREIYNIIYVNMELFHKFTEHEFMLKFMERFYNKGNEILENSKKSNAKIYKNAIVKTLKYTKEYIDKRNTIVNCVLDNLSKKTCKDASIMVKEFL